MKPDFMGHSGLKAHQLNNTYLEAILERQPSVVIVMLGGNDVYFHQKKPDLKLKSASETYENIMYFRKTLLQCQVPVLVAALITRPSGLAEIEKVNKQLTHELRTLFFGLSSSLRKKLTFSGNSNSARVHLDKESYCKVFRSIKQQLSCKKNQREIDFFILTSMNTVLLQVISSVSDVQLYSCLE